MVTTFQNPLKNQRKKNIKNTSNSKNQLATNNPLARKAPDKRQSNPPPINIPKQIIVQNKKLNLGDRSFWNQTRQYFINTFDVKKEKLQIGVANVFGEIGSLKEQQIRNKYKMQNKNLGRKEISIKAFLQIIDDMKKQIVDKWENQDKIGTLQFAIQAAKLMHDSENSKFHAIKFAYAIDIIDKFGVLVFQRIKSLAFPTYSKQKLKQVSSKIKQQAIQILGSNITEASQQICRNWLFKIGSIRQVLPRCLVETSLLRLQYFLDGGKRAKKVLNRLSKSSRCFGQSINVSFYNQCLFYATYLICVATQVVPQQKQYLTQLISDVFFYMKQGNARFARPDINYQQYIKLIQPFFKAAFTSFEQNCEQEQFKTMFNALPNNAHPLILKNLIEIFRQKHLGLVCVNIIRMLQKMTSYIKFELYFSLLIKLGGKNLLSKELVELCWTDISQLNDLQLFLKLLAPLIQIIFKNFQGYQKNQYLILILQKFNYLFGIINKKEQKSNSIFYRIQQFISTILKNTQDISEIVTIQPFLQLINYFPATLKVQISKKIVKSFIDREDKQTIRDPIVVHTLLSLGKHLNTDYGTFDSNQDKDQVAKLIIKFIERIDFGKDLQQLLNLYADVRAGFGTIQQITVYLIHKAIGLTIKSNQLSKGKITKKIQNFMQACLAYCYITIPMIDTAAVKLKLYKLGCQVCLDNNLISQGDSFLKMCISQFLQLPSIVNQKKRDQFILQQMINIINYLTVVPDDPQNEYLFMLNGIQNAIKSLVWSDKYAMYYKLSLYLEILVYLNSQVQESLPYHIDNVCSNDFLFKSKEFKLTVLQKAREILVTINKQLYGVEDQIGIDNNVKQFNQMDKKIFRFYLHGMFILVEYFHNSNLCVSVLQKMMQGVKKIFAKGKGKISQQNKKYLQNILRQVEDKQFQVKGDKLTMKYYL